MNIWSRGFLGPFWLAGRAKGGPGAFPDEGAGAKNLFFCEKGSPKGAFLEIPNIENGTKTARWRQDRHRDPLKTVPGSGFEKTSKINENLIRKLEVFDGLKPLKVCNCRLQTCFCKF